MRVRAAEAPLAAPVQPAPQRGASQGLGSPSASHRDFFYSASLLTALCRLKFTLSKSTAEIHVVGDRQDRLERRS